MIPAVSSKGLNAVLSLTAFVFLLAQAGDSASEPLRPHSIAGTKWNVTYACKIRGVWVVEPGIVTFFETEDAIGEGLIEWADEEHNAYWGSHPFNFVEKTLPGGASLFRVWLGEEMIGMIGWGAALANKNISMLTFNGTMGSHLDL